MLEHGLRQLDVDRQLVEACEGSDSNERAFELADVRADLVGDEGQDVVGDDHAVHLRLLAQDCDSGVEVGSCHISDEPPFEPADHSRLKPGQVLGLHIRRNDDLLVVIVKSVEGVKERFLCGVAALQELNVVDEQHVDVAISSLEDLTLIVRDRVDEVVRELFAGDVFHADARIQRLRVVSDAVQQVRLAEARFSVDEEWVVCLGRQLRDGECRCMSEAVGRADDECVEGVLRVERGLGGRSLDSTDCRGGRGSGGNRSLGLGICSGRNLFVFFAEVVVCPEFWVHDNAERRDVHRVIPKRLHNGNAEAMVEHFTCELARNLDVEHVADGALRLCEVKESAHLRQNSRILIELGDDRRP